MSHKAKHRFEEQDRPVIEHLSRRTMIKIGAGAGVAAALATSGVALAGQAAPQSSGDALADGHGASTDTPIIVHLVDARQGTVEVYTSSACKQIKDHDLAARIARAARG